MTTATTPTVTAKNMNELTNLDKSSLLNIIFEQTKRIQDLERLVEEQKRLRLQDSNQVEEKAAKIKEWVTNKLKELENQNKQLREQNRKQKDAVESLSSKLASLNNVTTSPRRRNQITTSANGSANISISCQYSNSLDKVEYIDRVVPLSPINTIDVNQSLKTRRPQLRKQSTDPSDNNGRATSSQLQETLTLSTSSPYHLHLKQRQQQQQQQQNIYNNNNNNYYNSSSAKNGISLISIGDNHHHHQISTNNSGEDSARHPRQESPLYDCVNIELVNSASSEKQQQDDVILEKHKQHDGNDHTNASDEPVPPPLPPHQFDKWELELYNLAEQTFSSLMQDSGSHSLNNSSTQPTTDSVDRDINSCISRKSSSSFKNDFISVIKPSFTTIDGDQVVDNNSSDSEQQQQQVKHSLNSACETRRSSNDHSGPSSGLYNNNNNNNDSDYSDHQQQQYTTNNTTPQSQDILRQKLDHSMGQNALIFSSPIRCRSSKDTILRTQSVRRQPAPEKLYDFIASDLVKRGHLVKHGALRSHQRWFVLKNFHLYSYKREADETDKTTPSLALRLEPTFQLQITNQSAGDGYPFKLIYNDNNNNKSLILIADSSTARDEWIGILTVAINMSDIEAKKLTKNNSTHEGMLRMARHGNSKRCHAILLKHVVYFLKSPIDPTPIGYVSVKGAKIREVMDTNDYDPDEQLENSEQCGGDNNITSTQQDIGASLAIYPRYSLNLDPVYLTLANQQDTDEWFYHLAQASGSDQSSGTEFERQLTQMMLDNSSTLFRKSSLLSSSSSSSFLSPRLTSNYSSDSGSPPEVSPSSPMGCPWRRLGQVMIYSDKPISQPLTSLPNETLRVEAVELFKSILLFTKVPLEPIAIDYHVCLLQNCFTRFLKYPELRNEFFAQLIKQSTYIKHNCFENHQQHQLFKALSSSSGSSGSASGAHQRSSFESSTSSSSPLPPLQASQLTTCECYIVTDLQTLEKLAHERELCSTSNRCESSYSQHQHSNSLAKGSSSSSKTSDTSLQLTEDQHIMPPTKAEFLQIMQILAIAVSLNLPRGRLRWWLVDHLKRIANTETSIGKYASFTLQAIERTATNGCRETVPSRTEIMSILLRNPFDHSAPHSLPVTFADGSYLVIGADGSTTIEEFMATMGKSTNIRPSPQSDFYLFADDPGDADEMHILEPQRKVLDVVGWWEQVSKQNNSGRQQNSRVIKFLCRKRLVLSLEEGETDQERLLIVNQVNQEIISQKIPLNDPLIAELGAILVQLTHGDHKKACQDAKMIRCVKERILANYIPQRSDNQNHEVTQNILEHWQKLSGRSAQDCIRVYLNCIRRLKSVG